MGVSTLKPIVITNDTGQYLRQLLGNNFVLSLGDPRPTDWGGVIFSVVNLGFFSALWFLSWKIKFRDFNLWFMICQLIPLSLSQFFQFILDLNYRVTFLGSSNKWHVFENGQSFFHRFFIFLYTFLQKTIYRNIVLGTGLLLLTCIIVARHRVALSVERCYIFCGLLIACAILGFLQAILIILDITSVDLVFSILDHGCSIIHSIAYIVSICAVCCCSFAHNGMVPDPYVSNARSRMGWTWLFVSFAFAFFLYAEAAAQVNSGYIQQILEMDIGYKSSTDKVIFDAAMELVQAILYFLSYFAPILLLISAVIFYPSYRSVCFGTQGYDTNLWAHSVAPVPHTGLQMKAGAPSTDGYQDTVIMAPAPIYPAVPPAQMTYQNADGSYQMIHYPADITQYQQPVQYQHDIYNHQQQYQQSYGYNQQYNQHYSQPQQPVYYPQEQYTPVGNVPQYG